VTKYAKQYGYPDFTWQPRFHEHMIRDLRSMENIRRYIINNPLKWESDTFHG
jgi:putative transposase